MINQKWATLRSCPLCPCLFRTSAAYVRWSFLNVASYPNGTANVQNLKLIDKYYDVKYRECSQKEQHWSQIEHETGADALDRRHPLFKNLGRILPCNVQSVQLHLQSNIHQNRHPQRHIELQHLPLLTLKH